MPVIQKLLDRFTWFFLQKVLKYTAIVYVKQQKNQNLNAIFRMKR